MNFFLTAFSSDIEKVEIFLIFLQQIEQRLIHTGDAEFHVFVAFYGKEVKIVMEDTIQESKKRIFLITNRKPIKNISYSNQASN